jgi:hypothetical protein
MKLLYPLLLIISLFCASCNISSEYIEAQGTITYVGLEGGFWGIMTEDGRKFDPVDLPDKFKKNGLKVRVKLRPRDDLAGTHMWGQMVEVVEIAEVTRDE